MLMTSSRKHLLNGLGATALVLFCAGEATAQSGQTAQIPLQFDFLTPGARSLGLGSAFVAVADDATAAFTNPAGLTFLARPEVSVEFRARRLVTPFLSGGRLRGASTGIGADTSSSPVYSDSVDSSFRPYYLSFVYPIGRMYFAGYRHELVRQNNDFESEGPFQEVSVGGGSFPVRLPALSGSRSITVDNFGGSMGYRLTSSFSVGVGVSAYRFGQEASFASFGHPSGTFGPPDPNSQIATAVQAGDQTRVAVNAGALFTLSPAVRVGVVFRQGAEFEFQQFDRVLGAIDAAGTVMPLATRVGLFRVPQVLGIGMRWQPSDTWSVAVDYDNVQYSRLKENYIEYQVDETAVDRVSVPDANEVHIGFEYTLVNVSRTPSIRGGVWYDPEHAVEYDSDGSGSANDNRLSAVFPGGESVMHYTVGMGLPLSTALEFNVGADFTKERRYFSASVVARFGN